MEPRYILDKDFKNSYGSKHYRSEIKADGFCIPFGGGFRVYSGTLAALLTAEEVPVNIDTTASHVAWKTKELPNGQMEEIPTVTETGERKQGFIRGQDYIKSYCIGYKEGAEWFRATHRPDSSIIYSLTPESYTSRLHDLLFHNYKNKGIGLIFFKGWLSDVISYNAVLESGYYSGIIAEVELLIEDYPFLQEKIESCRNDKKGAPQKTIRATLLECFEYVSKYQTIMNLLVEKELCHAGTYKWINKGSKGILANLIKYLYAQGYYKGDIPSTEETVLIAKNTFGISISESTAKKAEVPTGNKHNLFFVVPASAVPLP